MDWTVLSNKVITEEIGKRTRAYRMRKRLTQQQLAERAGVSLFSVAQIENGKSVSLSIFLSILRELRLLDNLEMLLPEIGISPIEMLQLKNKTPQRIRSKKSNNGQSIES
jgi:transcriptional regulator with XRE-family HTH domain